MKYHTIAEAFRKERWRVRLSQEKLAEHLNTNRHRIIDIENGRVLPDSKDIEGACRVFNIRAAELLCMEEPAPSLLDEVIDGLTDEKVDLIIDKVLAGLERRR